MLSTEALVTLFGHHRWANLQLLERCAALTSAQLEATVPGAYGSIRDTLRHMVESEHSYYWRISTGHRRPYPSDADSVTIADMIETLRETGDGLIAWVSAEHPNQMIEVDWDGTPRDVPKTIFLAQVINHATEHRAQIMVVMTQLGIQPPDIDAWQYFDQSSDYRTRSETQ